MLQCHLVHNEFVGENCIFCTGLAVTICALACAGVVKIGVQLTLFVAMLFLLLSAKQDPFQQAVRILPMSETAKHNTAASFSEALRGVFQSALKLAVFHAVFTWLTFRAFGVGLVYVPTLLSAVCAILPLVQVWMVAIPAALQLILQVCVSPMHCHATFEGAASCSKKWQQAVLTCVEPANVILVLQCKTGLKRHNCRLGSLSYVRLACRKEWLLQQLCFFYMLGHISKQMMPSCVKYPAVIHT